MNKADLQSRICVELLHSGGITAVDPINILLETPVVRLEHKDAIVSMNTANTIYELIHKAACLRACPAESTAVMCKFNSKAEPRNDRTCSTVWPDIGQSWEVVG